MRTAIEENTKTFDEMRTQIAKQGDSMAMAEVELKDQHVQNDALKAETEKLKNVLAKMTANSSSISATGQSSTSTPAAASPSIQALQLHGKMSLAKGRVQDDAYQAHLLGQIKEKNEVLHKVSDQKKEMATHFRKLKSTLKRQKKELYVLEAKGRTLSHRPLVNEREGERKRERGPLWAATLSIL